MSWQKNEADSDANAHLMGIPLASIHDGRMVATPAGSFLDLAKQYPDTSAGTYAALLGGRNGCFSTANILRPMRPFPSL